MNAQSVFTALGRRIRYLSVTDQRARGPIVDRDANKKDRRRKMPGANKKMDRAVDKRAGISGEAQGAEPDAGLSPGLQAHIGRHVRGRAGDCVDRGHIVGDDGVGRKIIAGLRAIVDLRSLAARG